MGLIRGEIYLVDFGPPRGREKAKVRPAVVLSINAVNTVGFVVVVVPGTNGKNVIVDRQGDVRVLIRDSGLRLETVFEARQVTAIDPDKVIHRLGVLTAVALNEVEAAVRLTLGL